MKVFEFDHGTYYNIGNRWFFKFSFVKLSNEEIEDIIAGIPLRDGEFYKFIVSQTGVDESSFSMWEWLTFIKNIKEVPLCLKSAFIQSSKDWHYLTIACEAYDDSSDLTEENIQIIEEWLEKYESELLSYFKKDSLEIEYFL